MLRFACFSLLVAVVVGLELSAKLENHWEKFKSTHKKSYSAAEEEAKKEVFKKNVEAILEHNLQHDLGDHSHTLGINEYADMTHEEFKAAKLGLTVPSNISQTLATAPVQEGLTLPAAVDLRQYLTPIKNQGSCGSCWTFSVTGALEGHVAMYSGQRVTLSEQNLLDCSSSYGNGGCNGGFPDYAFQYIIDNRGIDLASCYGYTGQEGYCRYNAGCVGARMSRFVNVQRSEAALMQAVATAGPVAVGMDAGNQDLQMYNGGIYDSARCSNVNLNHAVVVVGYGTEGGKNYWLVRNSWGTSWGIGGYFKVARAGNRCGLINTASYPVL